MDEEMNHRISLVLTAGMSISIIVIVLGLGMLFLVPGDYEEITMSFGEIADGILEGNPIALINLGIILLIATPLVRVISLTISFLIKKEMKFVAVCAVVLLLISVTIILKAGA